MAAVRWRRGERTGKRRGRFGFAGDEAGERTGDSGSSGAVSKHLVILWWKEGGERRQSGERAGLFEQLEFFGLRAIRTSL